MTAEGASSMAATTQLARPQRAPEDAGLRPGWITIAAKEFADHLTSARFYVLLMVSAAAALIPLYFAAERIRALAADASGAPAVFLALFTVGPEGVGFVRVDQFVGIATPLLGLGFAFDAVNGERSQGTLPRLLSQPLHRDDVVNGKFAAGLAIIALALSVMIAIISGFGLLRLGITPDPSEVLRLIAWLLVTTLYVALWLAFGLFLSVVIRRAATSALVGFGVWLFVAMPFVGPLLVSLAGQVLAAGAATAAEAGEIQQLLLRLLPSQLYAESTLALLNPSLTTVNAGDLFSPQLRQQLPTLLSVEQSVLLIVPHLVVLSALTIGCFALAYARFMRQEVRA
jgi:ABC-2 type transport system permease protein